MDDPHARAEAAWKDEKTAFQRVKAVVSTTYSGATASDVAEQSLVAETTARTHLEDLAAEGFVETESDPATRGTLYSRSWESLTFEQAQDIRRHTDSETLLERIQEMHDELAAYREETGLESPEDLAWSDADVDRERILEWKTTRRNLSFAKVALALEQAAPVVREHASG